MTDYGFIIIEKPEGAPIFVNGSMVGTVAAPTTEKGKLRIDSTPQGAKIYLKKAAGEVYHGLTPQTLELPAGLVPYLLRLEKAEFGVTHDLVYIPPGEIVSKNYVLERVWAPEPEIEPTATLTVRSTPPAEIWLFMEGAEGFISYGTTPKTLTLKATKGMWVPMEEAKRARTEARITGPEAARFDKEDARRTALIEYARAMYEQAKVAREDADRTLSEFRLVYNEFMSTYRTFMTRYNTVIKNYNALMTRYNNYKAQYSEFIARYQAASVEERRGLDAEKRRMEIEITRLESEIHTLEAEKMSFEAEKAGWDADTKYWSNILKYYEERLRLYREYEQQMKNEYEEAMVRAKSPFWMVTPGLLGTTWRLKLTKGTFQDVIDKITLSPGQTYTKDYGLVQMLDVTTPESLAPFIEYTPPPTIPDIPFAKSWIYIVLMAAKDKNVTSVTSGLGAGVAGVGISRRAANVWCSGKCQAKFIEVPPGRRIYTINMQDSGGYGMTPKARIRRTSMTKELNLAPGETRYVAAEFIPAAPTKGKAPSSSSLCPFGTPVRTPVSGVEMTLCGRPRVTYESLAEERAALKARGEAMRAP